MLRRRTDHGSSYGVESDVVRADGPRLRAWRNGGTGPAVLVAPGLGTLPEAWPRLCDPACGLDVVTWYQRGTFGSARPQDPEQVDLAHHVDDAIAVLDAAGLDRVVVAGWSMGATIACALAVRAPERVAGILGVAGVPDDTFSTIGAPLGVPAGLRRPLATIRAAIREAIRRAGADHLLLSTDSDWVSSVIQHVRRRKVQVAGVGGGMQR